MGIWSKNIIHNILEFTKCIFKIKGHYIPLVMGKWSSKISVIPIFLNYLNLLKSKFHIKLTKYVCIMKSIE